ncbi:DUF2442 domain-containing protein [Cryomorpha ignava]|uniref:DUF2442 domain-containing protein n=1 Tax=Cryomorpha ignava TaxID=101383 RepID=A0A7K3WM96_9FLAO|nr:DUF2442 domain-containing protein [Cryomorpha ignava]NEN22012.1 DUF2442 domain-containing protein [Cryomorpha ignava]
MNEVVEIKVLEDYQIWLKFQDDEEKVINIRPYIGKGIAEELLDPDKFKSVFIEPGGGIAWSNGYDFCPNFLKELTGVETQVS